MVCTLVPALEKHGKRVVTRFLNYLGNSCFALQLPPSEPPLVFVVLLLTIERCLKQTLKARSRGIVYEQGLGDHA